MPYICYGLDTSTFKIEGPDFEENIQGAVFKGPQCNPNATNPFINNVLAF